VPNVQWKTPDDGQRNSPKHIEFIDKNKFGKISAPVGFIKKKFVTMHSNMNVKFIRAHGIGILNQHWVYKVYLLLSFHFNMQFGKMSLNASLQSKFL